MSNDWVINVEGITKRYRGVTALEDVSFGVAKGQIVALIGPNGAGKSTTLDIVSGFTRPTSGQVLAMGLRADKVSPARLSRGGVSRTFQRVKLYREMSVREHVMVGAHNHARATFIGNMLGSPRSRRDFNEAYQRATELLDLVGLSDQADLDASLLSYGQQRLLEIARALAADPEVLLLDEPAAGLNAVETRALADLLLQLQEKGGSYLVVEHDMEFVSTIADHVVVLDFGRKIAEGTIEHIRANPQVIAAYLGPARSSLGGGDHEHSVDQGVSK